MIVGLQKLSDMRQKQKGYWIDRALLAGIVICLVLLVVRYLRG
jgi:hypothetical protein